MISNKSKRNRQRLRRVAKVKQASTALSAPIRLSMLGKTATREIDALVNIFAVNGLGSQFYSFGSSTGVAVLTSNLSTLFATQFPEYSNLVRDYSLVQFKSIAALITRNSTLLSTNQIAGNTPSVFLQFSPNGVSNSTGTATADNSFEFNLQTFASRNLEVMMPPCLVTRYNNNDFAVFGSSVWWPTIQNGNVDLPPFNLNLGYLAPPSFQTGAATAAYSVIQIHLKLRVVLAGPTNQ